MLNSSDKILVPDVKFIDASDWVELTWLNSGGTRAKCVLQDPEGKEWYFKCSEKKPAKDGKPEKHYKYEFWNEIISYQLGNQLGLNILRYDVALFDGQIGCISPLMINPEEEQLIELGRYMTALNPNFLPDDQKTRKEYTFQLLEATIDEFKLSDYWEFFFQTLLFDVIIGNTDRHQENWAFITNSSLLSKSMDQFEEIVKRKEFNKTPKILQRFFSKILDNSKTKLKPEARRATLSFKKIMNVAPIYDSGSSLARELTDERVLNLLTNDKQILEYIDHGKAELHWINKKISHYELINNLLCTSYYETLNKSANFLKKWNIVFIKELLESIDKGLPENSREYIIPKDRKELIIKLLTLRFDKLNKKING